MVYWPSLPFLDADGQLAKEAVCRRVFATSQLSMLQFTRQLCRLVPPLSSAAPDYRDKTRT